jgi:hypothetical protein
VIAHFGVEVLRLLMRSLQRIRVLHCALLHCTVLCCLLPRQLSGKGPVVLPPDVVRLNSVSSTTVGSTGTNGEVSPRRGECGGMPPSQPPPPLPPLLACDG